MIGDEGPAWFPRHRINKLILYAYSIPRLSALKEELAKAEMDLLKSSMHFDNLISRRSKGGPANDLDNIIAERTSKMVPLRDRVDVLKTEIIYERLRREDIHYDLVGDDLAKFGGERKTYLTPEARARLEKEVVDKRNARWVFRDARLRIFITLITALTGLLGTLIGLFAVTGAKH